MHCYYHDDQAAVGVCKSCGKGLCRECAVDLTKGLACRGHCEADVQGMIQLIDRNIRLSATASRTVQQGRGIRIGAGIFHILIGGLFFIFGIRDFERLPLIVFLGAGLIAYGIYWLLLAGGLGKNKQP
jgi:hypothetical protein